MRRGLCTKDNKTKLMQHPAIAAQRRVSYNVGRARILYGAALIFSESQAGLEPAGD